MKATGPLVGLSGFAIHESDQAALLIADELQAKLQSYPVLDEDDLCQRENDAANEVWRNCYGWQERVKYIRANRSQFDFRDLADTRKELGLSEARFANQPPCWS